MDNNILRDIIDVEKEIQQALDRAQSETRAWLEARKQEAEEELARDEEQIRMHAEQAREQALRDAQADAADRVRQAEESVRNLSLVNDAVLSRCVERHIRKILPE